MIVYLPTDRIELQIGEITLTVSPLSSHHADHIASMVLMQKGVKKKDPTAIIKYTLSAAVTDLRGVFRPDGKAVKLHWKNHLLIDESIELIFRLGLNNTLCDVASKLFSNTEHELKEIEGVEIPTPKSVPVKKKKKKYPSS